ncbi:MAG: hypothetical protein V4623_03435 [Pseudomonadota bacterium]
MEIYLKNIAKRWGLQAAKANSTTPRVFSPYITSKTAENVLSKVPCPAEIYTLFFTELFANGSSSVRTLRKLHEQGHALFDLPGLHAKIVHFPGSFASIGVVQNLRASRLASAGTAWAKFDSEPP